VSELRKSISGFVFLFIIVVFWCYSVNETPFWSVFVLKAVYAVTMLWLRILTPRAVWRTRLQNSVDGVSQRIRHELFRSSEESSRPVVNAVTHPVYYSTDQCHARYLHFRIKANTLVQHSVHEFSSSRKPLLYSDDLLQNYIKQIVAEWNQIQKQLTDNQSDSGQLSAQHSSKRLHYLEPIVSKVQQHKQYSVDISELEDIISGMCAFYCSLWKYFYLR